MATVSRHAELDSASESKGWSRYISLPFASSLLRAFAIRKRSVNLTRTHEEVSSAYSKQALRCTQIHRFQVLDKHLPMCQTTHEYTTLGKPSTTVFEGVHP